MKVAVILSEAKDLQFRSGELMQILRFAQNDRLSRMTADSFFDTFRAPRYPRSPFFRSLTRCSAARTESAMMVRVGS